MERLYREYGDEIEFVIVYIREAHPEMLREGHKTGVVGRPSDINERIILATECVSQFKFTIPMVIDGMEGTVNAAYDAAPVRVTITDREGKVAYYAGRGPFDFRLSKVEKVLKRLVENSGRVPPPPPVSWGEPSGGLRLGLGLDPRQPLPGDDVSVILEFENVKKEPVFLYYASSNPFLNLTVKGERGQTLSVESTGVDPLSSGGGRRGARRGSFRLFPQKIEAGGKFRTDIEGRIPETTDTGAPAEGAYAAEFAFEVTERMTQQIRRYRDLPYWEGRTVSGAFDFSVGTPRPEQPASCMSCHGVQEYHHAVERDCNTCHIGVEGTPEFAVNHFSCSECHPRGNTRGRRLITDAEGSITYTVHAASMADDAACVRCHDTEQHQQGEIVLVDPGSNAKTLWTGTATEFCLKCHGGSPPPDVRFPEAGGTRFDKSTFLQSDWHKQGMVCTSCHAAHGSPYPPLLKMENMPSPHK